MSGLRTLLAAALAFVLLGTPALAADVVQAGARVTPSCCPLAALMAACPMGLGAESCPELQLSDCDECCAASSLPALPNAPAHVLPTTLELRHEALPTSEARTRAMATKVEGRSENARLRLAERRFANGSSALLSIFLI